MVRSNNGLPHLLFLLESSFYHVSNSYLNHISKYVLSVKHVEVQLRRTEGVTILEFYIISVYESNLR